MALPLGDQSARKLALPPDQFWRSRPRAVADRYKKTGLFFLGFLHLAAALA
jgi:hypothetical protein